MIGVAGLALITILGPGQEVVTMTALCLLESSGSRAFAWIRIRV